MMQGAAESRSPQHEDGRRGVWQPKFWEHTIEEEDDFESHFDYIHFNPVKHGYVRCPVDWEWSSFHRWVRKGVYSENWACGDRREVPGPRRIAGQSVRVAASAGSGR